MTRDRDEPRRSAGIDPARIRRIETADGTWIVQERPLSALDRRATTLIFERAEIVRRVRQYPADWFTLSDEALLALSETY